MSKEAVARMIASLVKAANDPGLRARMEKSAGFGSWLGRQAVRATPGLNRTFTRPPAGGMGPRTFSPGRIAATAGIGAGGVGAVGGAQALQDAHNQTTGRTLNPATWLNPRTNQQVFDHNKGQYEGMQQAQHGQIAEAYGRGDFDEATHLQGQMDTGQFNQNPWWNPSMGGLNPFAQGNAKGYADAARGAQGREAGQRDALKKYLAENGGNMAPEVKARMEEQLGGMNTRQGVRIPWGGGGAPPAPAAPAPQPAGQPMAGGWNLGGRPRMPGYLTGHAMMPGDYRPYSQPWDAVQTAQSPFQQS